MVPLDISHTISYSSSIVTMVISCTVFERKRYIGQKRQFFIPIVFNLHDRPQPPRNFSQIFNTNCPSR